MDPQHELTTPRHTASRDIRSTRLIRRPEVERLTGLKKSQLYALSNEGDFPQRVKLGNRSVAWPENLVNDWIAERMAASLSRELI